MIGSANQDQVAASERKKSPNRARYDVRFASTEDEIIQAQELRFRTLFVEKGAAISDEMRVSGREVDRWDTVANHVVVVNKQLEHEPVVGYVRLTSSEALRSGQGFYTEEAFDLSAIREKYPRQLELSRACIDSEYRSGSILMLLWKFTMQHIIAEKFDVMLGCASFPGADIEQHRAILSWLYENNLAPSSLQPTVRATNHCALRDILVDGIDWDEAKQSVPPLLRGYLKIGAKITDAAVIDEVFNSVFVGIYVDARDMVVSNHKLVRKV